MQKKYLSWFFFRSFHTFVVTQRLRVMGVQWNVTTKKRDQQRRNTLATNERKMYI
jgi:hypothetical protein